MTEQPVKVVGRCIVCGELIIEVADVKVGAGFGLSVEAKVVRRCGCGDFEPVAPRPDTP